MWLRKILQDCDYTQVCFREDLCPNSIIRHLFSFLVAKYGTCQDFKHCFRGILLFLYKIMTIHTQERYLKMNMAKLNSTAYTRGNIDLMQVLQHRLWCCSKQRWKFGVDVLCIFPVILNLNIGLEHSDCRNCWDTLTTWYFLIY